MAPSTPSPTTVTLRGRLSFPVFTYDEALARSQANSKFDTPADKVKPEYNLLVEQDQLDKLTNHILNVFLPYALNEHKTGNTKFKDLDEKQLKKLEDAIRKGDWADQPPNHLIKVVHEKTAELVPEAVASIKVFGNAKQDLVLKAIVRDESELAIPDANQLTFPLLKPINETVHEMYPGCIATTTLNLYAYKRGQLPGLSAGGPTLVFKADAEQLGGGSGLDEDEIFAD